MSCVPLLACCGELDAEISNGVTALRGCLFGKPRDLDSEEVDDGIWNIVFYNTLLGRIDRGTGTITGNEKVKVTAETTRAWLVAYLPSVAITQERARETLEWLVGEAPVAKVVWTGAS